MELIFLLPLIFLLLKAASEFALIVIAYAAWQFMKLKVPQGPSVFERLKRAWKAF
jgi:hypothetical protein